MLGFSYNFIGILFEFYNYFQDKNGKILHSDGKSGFNILKKANFYELCRKGEIVQKTTVSYQISIHYGKLIMDNLNSAWKNSLLWGLLSFILIFPLSYFILILIELFQKSKFWVKKHATN